MKTTLAAVALVAAAAVAVALPEGQGWYLRRADEVHLEGLPIVDLEVVDERFGGVIFSGTAESIYNEMKELKPELFTETTGVDTSSLEVSGSLDKRQGSFNCGWGSRIGSWSQCIEGVGYLDKLGSAWCVVAPAPACARVSCSHSCGMYLCNKLNATWRVSCGDIATDINAIANECINVLGQVFGARDFNTHFIGLGKDNC